MCSFQEHLLLATPTHTHECKLSATMLPISRVAQQHPKRTHSLTHTRSLLWLIENHNLHHITHAHILASRVRALSTSVCASRDARYYAAAFAKRFSFAGNVCFLLPPFVCARLFSVRVCVVMLFFILLPACARNVLERAPMFLPRLWDGERTHTHTI